MMRTITALLLLLASATATLAQAPRPYKCGFVLESTEAIGEVYGPELRALDLRAGQSIADVGGSNGYRMGMFAAVHDSLDLWVEDIDSLCLNATEVAAVMDWHARLRGAPLTSTLRWVLGDSLHTRLPDAAFDKVLLTASYHHLGHPEAMLADIARKLKPGGRLYLIENVVRRDGQRRRRLCDDPLLSLESLVGAVEGQGWRVVAVHDLGRWWTKMLVLERVG